MPQRNAFPGLVFIVLFGLGLLIAYPSGAAGNYGVAVAIAIAAFVIASILASSIKVANQWERLVVLRLGRFHQLGGPGVFSSCRFSTRSPTGSTSASFPARSGRSRR